MVTLEKRSLKMNLHELLSTGGLIEPLKELTVDELHELAAQVADEIDRKAEKQFAVVELSYNAYKGSGKCWVAKVDPQTKAKLGFLDSTARDPRDGYSGTKTFSVPLVEGEMYLFCESGSKSSDSRYYRKVVNGKLEPVQ